MQEHQDPKNFKPGTYEHYKRSGNYVALALVSHHDTDELFVMYICGETGRTRIREWATEGKDSWNDMVVPEFNPLTAPVDHPYHTAGVPERVPRFKYIGSSA